MLIKSNPWGPLKRSFNTNWMSLMALEEGSVSEGGRPLTLLVTRAQAQWCCIFPVTVNYHDIVCGGLYAVNARGQRGVFFGGGGGSTQQLLSCWFLLCIWCKTENMSDEDPDQEAAYWKTRAWLPQSWCLNNAAGVHRASIKIATVL